MIKFLLLVASLFLMANVSARAAQAAPEANGPSFSCAAARTAVEKAICADSALAAADRKMATLFALARSSALGVGASDEMTAQRAVLKEMRACGKADRSVSIPAHRHRNGR